MMVLRSAFIPRSQWGLPHSVCISPVPPPSSPDRLPDSDGCVGGERNRQEAHRRGHTQGCDSVKVSVVES